MRPGHDQGFETFVSGSTSAEAAGLSIALAEARPDGVRLLLLCGPPGVGKTHLLGAIVKSARERCPAASIIEISAAALVQRMVAGLKADVLRFELAPADWLVVDDLHVLSGKPVTQAEVGRLLTSVVDRGGRVACASGGSVARIQALADTVQRMTTARIVELGPPLPREMRRILVRHASGLGLRLSAATTAMLAAQGRGDVRCAIGALTRLQFERGLRT